MARNAREVRSCWQCLKGSRKCLALDRFAPHEVLNSAYLPDVVHIYEPHRDHGFRMWETHDLHS